MNSDRSAMGVVIYALALHQKLVWPQTDPPVPHCLQFLDQCHRLGAGGFQFPFTKADAEHVGEVRRRADALGLFVEAIVRLPANDSDLDLFEAELRLAMNAGASLARTVMIPGRRYEQFKSYAEFKEAERRGIENLQRAEPIAAKHRFRLAVENHKDQLVAEKLETLRRLDSEYLGLCVDVGNNFPLLEDPVECMRAFAPWAMTVHIKDQAVRPSPDGFLMADVALGDGCLDLSAIVDILRTAKPGIHFNYETITRNPLRVPVLTPQFYATLPDLPAFDLARMLDILENRAHPDPFIEVSSLAATAQLELELAWLRTSLHYARSRLGL